MSIFESLGLVKKGTYTDEDPVANKEVKKPSFTPQNTFNPPVFATPVGNAKVDYLAHFKKLLKDKNLPGPDYIEFAESLDKLVSVPLSDQQKYESTFAVLSSMGGTPQKVISSADLYLQEIEKEVTTFGLEYKGKEKTDVLDKQSLIVTIQKENADLEKKIRENNTKISDLQIALNLSQQQLQIEKSAFEQAVNTMKQIINNHVQNIKTFLNVTTTK